MHSTQILGSIKEDHEVTGMLSFLSLRPLFGLFLLFPSFIGRTHIVLNPIQNFFLLPNAPKHQEISALLKRAASSVSISRRNLPSKIVNLMPKQFINFEMPTHRDLLKILSLLNPRTTRSELSAALQSF